MKKRLLVENDVDQLDDFQKILLLNKKKLNPDDVQFYGKGGEDYDEIVSVTEKGLNFEFDDLQDFLQFFFPDYYGSGSDGEYEAVNFERMYDRNYDFYSECQDRAYDDWNEGYTLGYLCDPALRKLKELVVILNPDMSKNFVEGSRGLQIDGESEMTSFLDQFYSGLGDDIDEIVCRGKDEATSEGARDMVKDAYCDGLRPYGIENHGGNYGGNYVCFRSYFISWGNLVQLYIDNGEFDEPALDVIFDYLNKNFTNHLPESYEVENHVWDDNMFNKYTCQKLEDLIDQYIESAEEDFRPEYMEVMRKIGTLGLFQAKQLPNSKYFMRVESVDPETLKINYKIGTDSGLWNAEQGIDTIENVVSMITQPGLFDPKDHRINRYDLKR